MSNENQHWVPRFLIKNFADSDGRVFCLDVQSGRITKPPPKYAASDAAFYDFKIGGKDVSFEDLLGKIETQAAPVIQRIVRSRFIGDLSVQHRKRVANFVAAQSFRTKAFYEGMHFKGTREDFGALFAEIWRGAFLIGQEIFRRPWAVMAIESDDVFYLGDNPVVLQRTEKPEDGVDLGFDVAGVEAFIPLAPTCALYMPCVATGASLISGFEKAVSFEKEFERDPHLRIKNREASLISQRLLESGRDLYTALTKGFPVIAKRENVENLNYLQAAWAHSAIYSRSNDFSFAERVFREHPQYKDVPRVSLATVARETPIS